MKKFALIVLLFLTVNLYPRPKLELSLSHVTPNYPEWYKRYDLNLTMNPSPRFGISVQLARLDFVFGEYDFNNLFYTNIRALYYFFDKNTSLYALLNSSASYDSDYYESYSLFFYTGFGFGMDWYFWERMALFAEVSDFLMFGLSKYSEEFNFNVDGNPKIVFGIKFNIFSRDKAQDVQVPTENNHEIEE
jgi:hypothetical protein